MAEEPAQRPGFWHTTTGLLTAIGGLIGALAALISALVAAGAFDTDDRAGDRADTPAAPVTVVSGPDVAETVLAGGASYSIELQMDFVANCLTLESRPSEQDCQCVLDRAATTYSESQFVDRINSSDADPALAAIFEDCFGA